MSTSKQHSELLIEFRISEIARRLCGYTIDMSETLINMLLSGRTNISVKEALNKWHHPFEPTSTNE